MPWGAFLSDENGIEVKKIYWKTYKVIHSEWDLIAPFDCLWKTCLIDLLLFRIVVPIKMLCEFGNSVWRGWQWHFNDASFVDAAIAIVIFSHPAGSYLSFRIKKNLNLFIWTFGMGDRQSETWWLLRLIVVQSCFGGCSMACSLWCFAYMCKCDLQTDWMLGRVVWKFSFDFVPKIK